LALTQSAAEMSTRNLLPANKGRTAGNKSESLTAIYEPIV
jgi:hypothetical protein